MSISFSLGSKLTQFKFHLPVRGIQLYSMATVSQLGCFNTDFRGPGRSPRKDPGTKLLPVLHGIGHKGALFLKWELPMQWACCDQQVELRDVPSYFPYSHIALLAMATWMQFRVALLPATMIPNFSFLPSSLGTSRYRWYELSSNIPMLGFAVTLAWVQICLLIRIVTFPIKNQHCTPGREASPEYQAQLKCVATSYLFSEKKINKLTERCN